MTKKKFIELLTLAAQPLPKGAGKSVHSYGYNELIKQKPPEINRTVSTKELAGF